MSANKKIVLIVILGVGSCLLSLLLSRYFIEKDHTNQLVLSQIQQVTARIEHIQLLGRTFVQNADRTKWQRIIQSMQTVRGNLEATSHTAEQWRQEIEALNRDLDAYHWILKQLYDPAVSLVTEKEKLQGIGLTFSEEVEDKIIKPYREEEGLRIYDGASIDPFKARVKETAYDLIAQHLKQQLLLFELLLSSDLEGYKQKKQVLTNVLAKHKAQLRYMNVLMGNETIIQSVTNSLDQKLTDLVRHEEAIVDYFAILSELDNRLNVAGDNLLSASRELSEEIISDSLRTKRLNRILNWSLMLGIVGGLGLLGTMLARDIIRFLQNLKQTQEELKESENNYRTLFNDAPVMYVITENRKGEPYIEDVNNMFLDVLGYNRQDVLGTPLAAYYTEDSKKELLDHGGYQRALEGVFTAEERTFIARDGRMAHCLLHALPEFDVDGRVVGTRAMFLDITDRKKAEEEAKRLEAALTQSQKMEAIGTLAGGIAHDFNNILAAVIGYAELALTDTTKGTALYDNLHQIRVAGIRASDLVRQILTFSRQAESELKPLQIGPLIKEALKLLRSSLPTTIEITQRISEDVDNVMADPTQIHQIIMNLCTNAAQAMEEDGGHLTVSLSQVKMTAENLRFYPDLKPGLYLKIGVQDTGKGIPPQIMEKIYHPYFTTKEKGKGTGLGLSVVHGIVQSYGGTIDVYSEPGRGTKFDVYIPAIKRHRLREEQTQTALPTGSERILLVDDEPALIEVGRQMLEGLGYQVRTVKGSLEALAVFQKAPREIDLVISDMTMPKMTGDKLATELLRIRKDLPIILCTGFSQKISETKAADLGVKALLMKPFVRKDLAVLVRNILNEVNLAKSE